MSEPTRGEAFIALVRQNPTNAQILDRLPQLGVQDAMLVAGCLFQTVWNLQAGLDPRANIRDHDIFYWDDDESFEAEDRVIKRAAALFADLPATIEIRNQARVHLWFNAKHAPLTRAPLRSVHEGLRQFLVRGTALGIDAQGRLHAPYGLDDAMRGELRRSPANFTPELFRAKALDYQARWPTLRIVDEDDEANPGYTPTPCRPGCGACCIAPSITSPLPGMPQGKPAGVPCVNLDPVDARCRIFESPNRPAFCAGLKPSITMCGDSRERAMFWLERLEQQTQPVVRAMTS